MRNIKSIIAVGLLAVSATAVAQNNESGYFTQGNLYRHDMNPAYGNDKNYVAMPILGNMTMDLRGNIDLRDYLYKRDGKTVTFLHPSVSSGDFMSNIGDYNTINEELFMQVLGAGFKGFGGYNTVEINVRENFGMSLPNSFFDLAKNGLTNKSYDISGLKANANSYVEVALGHSRQLTEKLRVGAKLKFLIGVGEFDAYVKSGSINFGENGYTANVDAEVNASVKGLEFKQKEQTYKLNSDGGNGQPKTEQRSYVNDMKVSNTGVNGFGMAVDLGGEYQINEDIKVSASINDLGFISWSENHLAYTNGAVNTGEYQFNPDDKSWNSFDNMMDVLGDDFSKICQLKTDEKDGGDSGSRTSMLACTLRFAGEYTMPFYRPLTVGLLNTTRIKGQHLSWTDFRLSANVAPCKVFSASGTLGVGTYGASLGGVLNFHCTGFSFFLASDHFIGSMAKQGVPLSCNGSFSMGMNFPF